MESFNNKHCEYCSKILERKKNEYLSTYKRRYSCNCSCAAKTRCLKRGQVIWDKKLIIKEFESIKDENKFSSRWMREKDVRIGWAVQNCYGGWSKFLIELGYENKIICNRINPKNTILAKNLLKYWREELDIKVGDVFEWVLTDDYIVKNSFTHFLVIQLLIKKKILKRLKRGKLVGNTGIPSNYKLLCDGRGKF